MNSQEQFPEPIQAMVNQPQPTDRIRVWIFGHTLLTHNQMKVAFQDNKLFARGGKSGYVIVRADFVSVSDDRGNDLRIHGQDCNIVFPVDAKDAGFLNNAENIIKNQLRTTIIMEARVDFHVPFPPHMSHGYITVGEAGALSIEKVPIQPGRQHASPGSNAWG